MPEHIKDKRVGEWYIGQATASKGDLHHITRRFLTTGQHDLLSCRMEWVYYACAGGGSLYGEVLAPMTKNKAQKGGEASADIVETLHCSKEQSSYGYHNFFRLWY